jgi:hypothetical protein
MLQAHSLLWHYLWVAPNLLLIILAFLIWKKGRLKQSPAFVVFAVSSGIAQLAVYFADIIPSVSAENFWRVDWAAMVIEGVAKLLVIAEIFALTFGQYSALARLSKLLIRGIGIALVVMAALAAAYAPMDSPYGLINGAHLLQQTIYLIETGLLVFIFFFSSYFHLRLSRAHFGIALGLSISACVHLAAWAIIANAGLSNTARYHLDFFSMATYHVCILIWYYYLLVPEKVPTNRNDPPDPPRDPLAGPKLEKELEAWNEELERLIHQ